MAIYQGADTTKAERAQSFWDVLQGKKRHDKRTLGQFGNRQLFSQGSNILEALLPQGLKQIVDVGSKQLEQHLFKMPEYKEDAGFWSASEVAALKEQDVAFREGADESLLESIIGSVGDYIGSEAGGKAIEGFDLPSFFSSGGGDLPEGVEVPTTFSAREGGRVPKYENGGEVNLGDIISALSA